MAGRSVRPGPRLKAVWLDAVLRRLARNASWGFASIAIEFALSLIETTLIARALGSAEYGLPLRVQPAKR